MFKETAKRLSSSLAEETIHLEPADLAAECQFCLNSQLSYKGVSPYVCLFGVEPSPIFNEDASEISSMVLSEGLPFYQHQQVRMRAIASFQGSLLQHRLHRATVARPRSAQDEALRPNMLIDFYRHGNKELTGWRGPATLLALLGNGLCSVRWQSTTLDIPTNHIRQHLTLIQYDTINDPIDNVVDERAAAAAPAAAALPPVVEAFVTELDDETGEREHELSRFESAQPLFSLAQLMPSNSIQVHMIEDLNGKIISSAAALRDLHATFNFGRKVADFIGAVRYQGVVLAAGRRFLGPFPACKLINIVMWTTACEAYTLHQRSGRAAVDMFSMGLNAQSLHNCRLFAICEGEPTSGIPLLELLKQDTGPPDDPAPRHNDSRRVRDADYDRPPGLQEPDVLAGLQLSDGDDSPSARSQQPDFQSARSDADSFETADPGRMENLEAMIAQQRAATMLAIRAADGVPLSWTTSSPPSYLSDDVGFSTSYWMDLQRTMRSQAGALPVRPAFSDLSN